MSEAAQGALIGGAFAFATLVATLAFNYWSLRRQLEARAKEQEAEQEERYRISLYDKRLVVHQQAHHWIYRLNWALNRSKPGEGDAPENKDLFEITHDARDWLDANSLYLDSRSRSELVYFFNLCFAYPRKHQPPNVNIWQQMNTAEAAIVTGIGMKHVEERKVEEPHD